MKRFFIYFMMLSMLMFKQVDDPFKPYKEPNAQYMLKATYYNNTPEQGWGDGQITASGKRLYGKDIDELRYVAMSRDMIKPTKYHKEIHGYNPDAPFEFGDVIEIKGANIFDGKWRIHDSMNKRYKKRIDFLVSKKRGKTIKFKSGTLVIVKKI